MDFTNTRSFPSLRTSLIRAVAAAVILTQCVSAKRHRSHKNPPPPSLIPTEADCGCFMTNSTQPGFFQKHMFFDFRSLSQYETPIPPYVMSSSQAAIAPPTSEYFATDEWNNTWQLQGWSNSDGKGHGLTGESTVLMVNSQSNVFVQKNEDKHPASDTYLTLRTKRLPKFQAAAAFESRNDEFQFMSLRMLARTTGSPGAVTAMFTFQGGSNTDNVQEADLEVLTRGPRETIQYTNQPGFRSDGSRNTQASQNVTMPKDLIWSDWLVHRLDWTPERSVWYVNGIETANISVQVPRNNSFLNFNAWSDGSTWSGNMSTYNEASFQIQWIEMVYNTSSTAGSPQRRARDPAKRDAGPLGPLVRRAAAGNGECKVVCSIDDTPDLGKASLLWNSTGVPLIGGPGLEGRVAWIWSLMAGAFVWYYLI